MKILLLFLPVFFSVIEHDLLATVQDSPPPIGNTLTQGVVDRVLAIPTASEIQNVLDELRNEDLTPRDVVIEHTLQLANKNQLTVVSHRIGNNRHFGAMVVPPLSGERKLPVVVMACGGDGRSPEVDIATIFNHSGVQFPDFLGGGLDAKCCVVIPSFRGQKLLVDNQEFLSEGNIGDAFDGATVDAIAFLNVALSMQERADQERVAIVGGSRGGTVALLAAARDPRFKKAVVIAAPTNMKELYLLYPDQFQLLFFCDLLAGKLSEADAREKFIASSPDFFCRELASVQIHHDHNDPFVPYRFATSLVESMNQLGKRVEFYSYDEQIHGFWEDPKFWPRVQAFLQFE